MKHCEKIPIALLASIVDGCVLWLSNVYFEEKNCTLIITCPNPCVRDVLAGEAGLRNEWVFKRWIKKLLSYYKKGVVITDEDFCFIFKEPDGAFYTCAYNELKI